MLFLIIPATKSIHYLIALQRAKKHGLWWDSKVERASMIWSNECCTLRQSISVAHGIVELTADNLTCPRPEALTRFLTTSRSIQKMSVRIGQCDYLHGV
jgi:succinylarginine dihydrolase